MRRAWVAAILGAALLVTGSAPVRPPVGMPAPPFGLTLFDGRHVSLKDLRGKVVLLNFWNSG